MMHSCSGLMGVSGVSSESRADRVQASPTRSFAGPSSSSRIQVQSIAQEIVPSVGLLYRDAVENLSIRKACEEGGTSVFQCNYDVEGVTALELDAEVDAVLRASDGASPLPQQIVKAAEMRSSVGAVVYPQLQIMQAYARRVVEAYDAILLPGGTSILPKFYGESFKEGEDRHGYNIDPQRTVLEFFLIHESAQGKRPLLCVCRGHQALNIFYGGMLDRTAIGDVQQHKVRSILSNREDDRAFHIGTLPKIAYFHHKQVVVRIGEGLHSVARIAIEKDLQLEQEALAQEEALMRECIGEDDPLEQLPHLEATFKKSRDSLLESLRFLEADRVGIAVESRDGLILGVQYHPEYLESSRATPEDIEANRQIFHCFAQIAKARKASSLLLNQTKSHGVGIASAKN